MRAVSFPFDIKKPKQPISESIGQFVNEERR